MLLFVNGILGQAWFMAHRQTDQLNSLAKKLAGGDLLNDTIAQFYLCQCICIFVFVHCHIRLSCVSIRCCVLFVYLYIA